MMKSTIHNALLKGNKMTTGNLNLPELEESQAGKALTVNEALNMLDVFAQNSLKSVTTTAPPSTPAEGDAYFVPGDATGDWNPNIGQLALWVNSQWFFIETPTRWPALIEDEANLQYYDGSSWNVVGGGSGGGSTGKAYVDVTGGNQTLDSSQSDVPVIQLGGTPGTSRTLTLAALERMWVVTNDSDSGCTLTTGSGGTVYLESGYQYVVFGDGVGVRAAVTIAPNGLKMNGDLILPIYSVASLPDPSTRYMVTVGCTDGDSGGPCLAVSDGGSWKRVSLGATVSTT